MPNKRNIIPNQNSGFFQNLFTQVKLILRLMGDRRVNFWLKILPVGALLYLILPIDLVPELALPVIGYLDDAAVLWIGMTLFVQLCPAEIVQEHMNALNKVVSATWHDAPQEDGNTEVIDVDPSEPDQEKK
jgi:uncharacterized membrane protein YkvA (DUF1232 family)